MEDNIAAQCIIVDPSHTYDANFENNNDNWVTGGTASDWTWGIPEKTLINTTALNNKCWSTGTLTTDGYNSNEASWVQSPCLDISGLQHPYIQFKVIWETGFALDGATIQYSTDHAISWETLGDMNDAQNCLNANWFNTKNIKTLPFANQQGWSGSNADGHGLPDWVTCNHTLPFLKGVHSIIFRFFFASGATHRNDDGFAFDNFSVKEAPPNNADFKYTCSADNTIQFTDNSIPCPANYVWNFDDPGLGSNNTSTEKNPAHTFSTTGTHKVSLSISGPENAPATVTKTLANVTANITQINSIKCFGDNMASATVAVSPPGNYSYAWNTIPPQVSATAVNLLAGNYLVEISGANICPVTQKITIAQPQPLRVDVTVHDALCTAANGSAAIQAAGGTLPYNYLWLMDNTTGSTHNFLKQGMYGVRISDANKCTLDTLVAIQATNPIKISLGKDTGICQGETIQLAPGNFTNYKWQDGSALPVYTVQRQGTYFVTVTNDGNCFASDTVTIYQDCGGIFFPTAFTPNGDGMNDDFGATGSVALTSNYTLKIFNRWGNLVFATSNPAKRWKGELYNQHNATETYTWFAGFIYKNENYQRKGTVTVIY